MPIRSIRFKITALYILLLALTLSFFSVMLYHNFRQRLIENTDDILQSRAEGIADSIDTYWEVERLEAIRDTGADKPFSKIDNLNFIKIAQRWVEERSKDPKLVDIVVQIRNERGRPIAASRNIAGLALVTEDVLRRVLSGKAYLDTVDLEIQPSRHETFREFILPVVERGKVAYIVRVMSPLDTVEAALKDLRFTLFVLLPLTVFLTGLIGLFLARVALSPVDRIINTIHQITAENLKLRIKIPDTKDEIKRLADTFNEMLTRLEDAFSSQKRFIADLTHELRTPLAVLKGELEVTLKRVRSAEEYDSVLHSSLEEVDRISKIVGDLMLLASFDNAAGSLEISPLDLGEVVGRVCEDIKVLADQKGIALSVEIQTAGKARVCADETKLKRLFINLLDNAVKYTPPKGRVAVRLEYQGDEARVLISDTGSGIPAEDLPHVFERFYRVDKSRSLPGFGLGLSIAQSIAQIHRGRILAESRLGHGSTFSVVLPLAR